MGKPFRLPHQLSWWKKKPGQVPSKRDQIRLRDGGRCWLCNRLIDFDAEKNTNDAPTIEHLDVSLNGAAKKGLTNLVYCHKSCNGHLRDHPIEKKEQMRSKWHRAYRQQWKMP